MRTAISLSFMLAALPGAALACGGLFCSGGGPSPAPVDQAAEQIIFEVGDGMICAHVTIDYVGDADEFAWIVPVPGAPEIGETDPAVFANLTARTNRQVLLPTADLSDCPRQSGSNSDGGCGCYDDDSGGSSEGGFDEGGGKGQPPVQILARTQTENYDAVTLAAESAADLVGWLQDNTYNVSDNMVPAMQPYLDAHMNFVAVRMREGRDAERIRPLVMCYPGEAPMVPLRLTAVAAQPLMGVQVFIVADHHYVPHELAAIDVDLPAIGFDGFGVINYAAWVARVVDEADGTAFVTEYRGENPVSGALRRASEEDIPGHQRHFAKVSRYFTRLSPHQMTFDPMFVAAPDAPVVNGVIDLTEHPSPITCGGFFNERLTNACGFEYCGAGATCTLDDSGVGCVCPPRTVAQGLVDGTGAPRVTCVPRVSPFAVQDDVLDVNPCDALPCGLGVCSLRGGFRACACEEGAMAVVSPRGVMCRAIADDSGAFGPGGGAEAQPTEEMLAVFSLKQSNPWFGLLFVVAAVWTRRRVRRS